MSKKQFQLDNDAVQFLVELLELPYNTLHEVLTNFPQHYSIVVKSKSGKRRKFYPPSPDLRKIQKKIDKHILRKQDFPKSMHGYVRGFSAKTNAACHVGKYCVAKFDIKNFFPSIHSSRVQKIFGSLGFSESQAKILTRLTTVDYCLPHGFVTSPCLALLTMLNLEKRIQSAIGSLGLTYTFYSDDFTISGNGELKNLTSLILNMFKQEGFLLNDKTEFQMYYQRQEVTGQIVNKALNIPSGERERLKAIIHKCYLHGPSSQIEEYWKTYDWPKSGEKSINKFKERLHGRIIYCKSVNQSTGQKLMRDFHKIDWAV